MSDDESLVDIPELNDEEEKTEDQIKAELKENVLKYVKFDDLIRKKTKEISELKKLRNPCEKFILKYLDQMDESLIEITGGKLRMNRYETKVPLNNDIIKETIQDKIKDPQATELILNEMENRRSKKVRINLKRTAEKRAM